MITYTAFVGSYSSCSSVCSVLCIQRFAAQPKKGSETVTFSPLVNTAAASETSIDSNPPDRIDDGCVDRS